MTFLERLGTETGYPIDHVFKISRHSGIIFRGCNDEGIKTATASVTLKEDASTSIAQNFGSLEEVYNRLGATFSPPTPALKQCFNLNAGVVIIAVPSVGFFDQIGI